MESAINHNDRRNNDQNEQIKREYQLLTGFSTRFRFRSIRTEIALGFCGLLLLAMVIAAIGRNSLERFSRGVELSESTSHWISTLIRLRRYEREYRISQDGNQLIRLITEINTLRQQIERAGKAFTDSNDRLLPGRVLAVTERYQQSFENYVRLQHSAGLRRQQLVRLLDLTAARAARLSDGTDNRYHQIKQELDEHWEQFLEDSDRKELLESAGTHSRQLQLRLHGIVASDDLYPGSLVELTASLAALTETLNRDDDAAASPNSRPLTLAHRIQQGLQLQPPDNRSAPVSQLLVSIDRLQQILAQQRRSLTAQMTTHRLRYDVTQGRLTRARTLTGAARQLQIRTDKLRHQEQSFLLSPSSASTARVETHLRQLELLVDDFYSQVSNRTVRSELNQVQGYLDDYRVRFRSLQQLISDRQQADLAMSNAMQQLQEISAAATEKRHRNLQQWQRQADRQLLLGSLAAIIAALLLALLIASRLSRAITGITRTITRVAGGEHTLATPGLARIDEIGHMARAVEVFKQTLVKSIRLQRLQAEENRARKKAEAEVLELNAELEARVLQRTKQLQQANQELELTLETLKQAQKQLVESEKMASLAGLVAGIAHELNTPVGTCITAASLLQEQLEELQQAFSSGNLSRTRMTEFIDSSDSASAVIADNLERTAGLVRTFKSLALEPDQQRPERYLLADMINDSLNSLSHSIDMAAISVSVRCDRNIALLGFPGDIFHIISQLINNAAVHAWDPDQRGNFRIAVEQDDKKLRLEVSDDGRGMTEQQRTSVFEPFYTTRRGQGGTGLGMHLVYNLVSRRLGGRIECRSKPGEGTRFIIQIPVDPNFPPSAISATARIPAPA